MTNGLADPDTGSRGVLFVATGTGKSNGFARLLTEAADASGVGRRTLRTFFVSYRRHNADPSWSSFLPFRVVDPVEALLQFLRRLIRLGRRADASRQLAVQRLRFACRAARLSPDAPPGEVVVSSSRVPRGPDMPRVISTVVDHSRVSGPV
jgi:hypothetical protein